MKVIENPAVVEKIKSYPEKAAAKLLTLRSLILQVAISIDNQPTVTETFKWGEASYVCKSSSTLRMDWKESTPNQVAMYFQCTSQLIPTFQAVFGQQLLFEGNRAIILPINKNLPVDTLKKCIEKALLYHTVKKLPLLGF